MACAWAVFFVDSPALATKLPAELLSCLKAEHPEIKQRIDGAIQLEGGDLYLPVLPVSVHKNNKTELSYRLPAQGKPDILAFSDGWFFLRVIDNGKARTILSGKELPDELDKQLQAGHFASDLVVPENFVLPGRLNSLSKGLTLIIKTDIPRNLPLNPPIVVSHSKKLTRGAVFITSPSLGKITLLDDRTLEKICEFPTEGTPDSITCAGNKIYITDQSKNRVLILDPMKRQFIGQIDLPAKTSPKGIVALPNGKLLYVSEYTTDNIDVIEVDTNKILLKTKVPAGPSRMAITPDGSTILVLNAPAGRVTLLSTDNQKMLGSIAVGTLPNDIAITKDSTTAYVSNRVSNTVSIIDIRSRRVAGTVSTGTSPTGLALDSQGKRLFVANAKDNTISVYDVPTRKKIEDIKLPLDVDFPDGLMLMPDGKRMIVSSASTEAIGVLSVTDLKFESQPVVGYPTDQVFWFAFD
jgi:YVTN family beta-propeller protein